MFENWNIAKHALMSAVVSLFIGSMSYFIIKPTDSASSVGIIGGADGPSAISVSFGFDTVIEISIIVFILIMIFYKLVKKVSN
ncbi:hypothetical protein [Terrisporobacter sp.]